MARSFAELSRVEWRPSDDGQYPGEERLIVGALQRIADASEKMAKNWQTLAADRDFYRDRYNEQVRANRLLRGQLTKARNQLKKAQASNA